MHSCFADALPLPLGKWLEMKGYETKPKGQATGSRNGGQSVSQQQPTSAGVRDKQHGDKKGADGNLKQEKVEVDKFEPWNQVLHGGFHTIKVRSFFHYHGERTAFRFAKLCFQNV